MTGLHPQELKKEKPTHTQKPWRKEDLCTILTTVMLLSTCYFIILLSNLWKIHAICVLNRAVHDLFLSFNKSNMSVLALLDLSLTFYTNDQAILAYRLHTDYGFFNTVIHDLHPIWLIEHSAHLYLIIVQLLLLYIRVFLIVQFLVLYFFHVH